MDNLGPIAWVCGIVCLWPLLVGFLGFYFGRRGMPIRIVTNYGPRKGSALRGKLAIRED